MTPLTKMSQFSLQLSSPKYIFFHYPEQQWYRLKDNMLSIVKPMCGSIIKLTNINTSEQYIYVVIRTNVKKKGNNKGIVDLIEVGLFISHDQDVIYYQENEFPIILSLTNHGEWLLKAFKKTYDMEWLTDQSGDDFFIPRSISILSSNQIQEKNNF